MRVLAFDTSLAACSVAIWQDGEILSHRFESHLRGHAELLLPMILAVVDEAGLDLHQFEAFAVTLGPGTFTGQRTGIAVARALRLALGRPIVGLTTCQVIAAGAIRRSAACCETAVVNDARRGEVYFQCFTDAFTAAAMPTILSIPEAVEQLPKHQVLLAGTGVALVKPQLLSAHKVIQDPCEDTVGNGQPEATDLAFLAAHFLRRDGILMYDKAPLPIYLRAPDAKPKLQSTSS